jgi:RNA polymerase sigma-70 factor (ECF subfamily)
VQTDLPAEGTVPVPGLDPRGIIGLDLDQERALVARAGRGEAEAVGRLYDAYVAQVYRYCLGRVRNAADAEDLTEEIFLKVIGAIEGFEWRVLGESERSPFRAWVFRIAHNHVVSFHRRAAARGPAAELSDAIHDDRRGPQELAETKIAIEEVLEVVRSLPDAQRDVILLRFVSGLSVAETATALDKQQTNVKVLQHKGIQRLKRLLGVAGDETAEDLEEAPAPVPIRRFGRR